MSDSISDDLGVKRARKLGPQSPAANRAKGTELEMWACKLIAKAFGREKDWQQFTPRAPESGARATLEWKGDIAKVGDAVTLFPFVVECRNRESWTWTSLLTTPLRCEVTAWYKEVSGYSRPPFYPMVIFKKRGEKPWCMVPQSVGQMLAADFQPVIWLKVENEVVYLTLFEEFITRWAKRMTM